MFTKTHNEQFEAKLLFRYGLVYRDVIRAPKIDVCAVTRKIQNDQDLANRVIFSAFNFIRDSYPEMIHECPYTVSIEVEKFYFLKVSFVKQGLNVRNFTGNGTGSMFSIFPTGEYKIIVNGWIGNEFLGKTIIWGSIKSSNRDTFG